ncbi:MAG: hypothetical protein R3251_04540 [Candidatus Spechtbacterales bacterium]|nr:hypothetical protein [Candidatus Spechtbacterales bacterium]
MEIFQQIFNSAASGIMDDPIGALNSILYSRSFILVQVISLVISAFLFYAWIWLLKRTGTATMKVNQLKEAWRESPVPKGKLASKWQKVEERINSNQDSEWKLAVIEADAMLDELIKAMGYKGKTMGERMREIKPEQFPRLDDAWRAHKVRNFIAHDPSYPFSKEVAQRTINIYRDIFKQFDIL